LLEAHIKSEKILKKVAGIAKLDDGLKKLDRMTNEEARMANAEALRIGHIVGEKLEGVDKKVQAVNKDVQHVGENVIVVEEKVQNVIDGARTVLSWSPTPSLMFHQPDGKETKLVIRQIAYNVNDEKRSSSVLSSHIVKYITRITGIQMRERVRNWQSPSDPSTNHNIACDLQHKGSAEWFCDGSTFEEWMVTGSLLWIHGKRMLFLSSLAPVI
jgi:hypothetical protein